jgi:hypothetical protein
MRERCGLVEAIQKLVGAAGWRIELGVGARRAAELRNLAFERVQRLNLVLVGRLGLSGAVDGRGGGVGA